MVWKEPKTNWSTSDAVTNDDFNRIEGNTKELNETKINKGCTWGDLKDVTS